MEGILIRKRGLDHLLIELSTNSGRAFVEIDAEVVEPLDATDADQCLITAADSADG
jgi:hypothetical protein